MLSGVVEDEEGEGGGGEKGRQRHGGKERGKEGTASTFLFSYNIFHALYQIVGFYQETNVFPNNYGTTFFSFINLCLVVL